MTVWKLLGMFATSAYVNRLLLDRIILPSSFELVFAISKNKIRHICNGYNGQICNKKQILSLKANCRNQNYTFFLIVVNNFELGGKWKPTCYYIVKQSSNLLSLIFKKCITWHLFYFM